ncbi:hypothetical protein [Fodinibius sediminis]|uniref:DUF3618 domain-containing protein n=1 Tax=Fodinibius sediminis TaxID=1214077 RepID=A0A521D9Q3_9BACT|nr:hypothetical protein [Fodinibius sediminis]SMO68446.1 hypothetical protein SAMN06265218_10955 [Fodinibius sediminis]
MTKDKVDKLEEKKRALEAELNSIQHELDDSIDQVRSDVSEKLDPKSFIREHPLPVVGGAVVLGFLLGHNDERPRKRARSSSSSSDGKFTSTLLYELKRLATKKALSFATDFMEQKFHEKTGRHFESPNGTVEE